MKNCWNPNPILHEMFGFLNGTVYGHVVANFAQLDLEMHRFRHLCRLYASQAPTSKSVLSALRRRTGFPISKCKEALMQHDNDLAAAESWLYSQAQKEGWAKAEKLMCRRAEQGLVGVAVRGNLASMVEVNCETDFVARNEKFQLLVSTVTETSLEHKSPKLLPTTDMPSIDHLTRESISGIMIDNCKTLADTVAETVGHLSENLVISRGCTWSASKGLICSFAYNNVRPPEAEVALGTYGALLHLLPADGKDFDLSSFQTLGRQLCQHVVGMNPQAVDPTEGVEQSQVLVEQGFVLDSSISVGDLLEKNKARVTKFVRYALGETTDFL